MFTKNPFNKKDEVADLIGNILESDYKVKKEELKGNQHKIDMNKNNKIDAQDFKILRAKGETQKEETDLEEASYSAKAARAGKDIGKPGKMFSKIAKSAGEKYGSAERGRKVAGAVLKKLRDEEIDPNRVTTDTLKGRAMGKDANPFLSKKVFMDVPGNVNEEVEDVAEGSEQDDDYSTASFEKWKKQKEYEREYDKKKPAKPTVPDNKGKKKGVDEEVEQLDELSKDTLKSYAKKANAEVNAIKKKQAEHPRGHISGAEADKKMNRQIGINQATKRIVKKDLTGVSEEVEQIDERELTKGETKEKERIVKGMKKNLAGFKQRYGERAKSVMYATATKAAKKD